MQDLGLYIHWPWCVRKCPYCDFNSYGYPRDLIQDHYIDSLIADLQEESVAVRGRKVTSVFIGGGTPSLMQPRVFERLMNALRQCYELADDAEISMEANPGTLVKDNLKSYVNNGVNRVSLGVQSFHDTSLRSLGRIHDARTALESIEIIASHVDNFNLDVMFALPGQTMAMLEHDLACALQAQSTHLSFYELTMESGTYFGKHPPANLPSEDLASDMADCVHETLSSGGFEHYEISAYARDGRFCRHNRTYWTYGDYIGVGAGAHGKITCNGLIYRTEKPSRPRDYMNVFGVSAQAWSDKHRVEREDIPFEFMLNALRLTDGVDVRRWEETTGLPVSVIENKLDELRSRGLMVQDRNKIACSALGRRFLSDVQSQFL